MKEKEKDLKIDETTVAFYRCNFTVQDLEN